MRKTLYRRQHVVLALQVLTTICVVQCIASIIHMHSRRPEVFDQIDADSDNDNRAPLLRHCIVLTTDVDAQPRDIARGLTCVPFMALPFDDGQFSLLTPDAQAKLREPFLLHNSGELSNNKSVNIYFNHVRIWRHILSNIDGPTLVLEDDAIVQPHVPRMVQRLLEVMYLDGVRNFIVKLHTNGPIWLFLQWDVHYKIFGVDVRKCTCRPHVTSSSAAAYIIDREAAQTMLESAYPASQHVDVYKHYMGCVYNKINMYIFKPDIIRAHVRPSVHWKHENRLHRAYLLAVEFIDNLRAGTCRIWRQPGVLAQIISAASSVPWFT